MPPERHVHLSTGLLIDAYSSGLFPMMHEDGELRWHDPDPRAIFPLDRIAPNARLRTFIRSNGYRFTFDGCFEQVMRTCADRERTWISEEMVQAYTALHLAGHAHSAEAWQGDALVGGVYGVSIGAAFFGESMFSRKSNGGKAAFFRLSDHLRSAGFTLFDTQYINDHTRSLGAIEIARTEFHALLRTDCSKSQRW
jgi:leucyl/phenylalanyl-tRNA---protein transferase